MVEWTRKGNVGACLLAGVLPPRRMHLLMHPRVRGTLAVRCAHLTSEFRAFRESESFPCCAVKLFLGKDTENLATLQLAHYPYET